MVWAVEREIVVIGGVEEVSIGRLEVAGGWGERGVKVSGVGREGVVL